WTLHEGLGDDFTDEIAGAWARVYNLVASIMKRASAGAARGSDAAVSARPPRAEVETPRPPAMFEEAATLHYPRALGLPDGMLPGDYVAPPQRPPVSAAAPQPAAEPPRGLVIPLSGPDGN